MVLLAGELVFATVYTAMILFPKGPQKHLHDGTFSLAASFWWTLPHSTLRMIWIWGLVALILLLRWRTGGRLVAAGLLWVGIGLAPYSFLTYMDRVPSRHTYLASAGIAFVVGLALSQAYERWPRRALAHALAVVVLIHNVGFLWWKKLPQYERRAEATERFLRRTAGVPSPIRIRCAPFPWVVYRDAAVVLHGRSPDSVLPPDAEAPANVTDYCDPELQ
jgi:hypothetical protein